MQDSLRNTKVEAIKAARAANFASDIEADLSTCKLCRLQDSLRCIQLIGKFHSGSVSVSKSQLLLKFESSHVLLPEANS